MLFRSDVNNLFIAIRNAATNKLGGLVLKTYDSDVFNNWVKTDWIDGENGISKSELIQKQVMEKTSGTEIINRMIKMGLIESFNDETDKRSVRVIRISEQAISPSISLLLEWEIPL